MKYGYAVKKNGVLYLAGTEVPGEDSKKTKMADEAISEGDEEQDKTKRGRKSKEEQE